MQIREVEVVERKEKDNLSSRYEAKIDELRKQLEFLTRDKAKLAIIIFKLTFLYSRLQIETDKANSGYEDLKTRVPHLERDLKNSEKDKYAAYAEIQDLNARLTNVDAARGQLAEENDVII